MDTGLAETSSYSHPMGKETVAGHPSALQNTQSHPFWGNREMLWQITGLPIPTPDLRDPQGPHGFHQRMSLPVSCPS